MADTGSKAAGFKVSDQDAKTLDLKDYRGKIVVLYFYPRASTPGCTVEAREFRDLYAEFQKRGVVVLGVSPDSVKAQKKFHDNEKLPFNLLADADRGVCNAYGVIKEKSMFSKTFLGVERTTFIIGPDGAVARVFRKVKPKGHAREILDAIDAMSNGPASASTKSRG